MFLQFANGMGSNKYSSSTTNLKTWGEKHLYRDSPSSDEMNNEDSDHDSNHFQLFTFPDDKIVQDKSRQFNRIGSESVPPGLGLFSSENTSLSSSNHSLYEDFDVMQIGSRRPASTGVIGQNSRIPTSSAVMETLGLISTDGTKRKQKPIMDLIEEDFPKTPPTPEYHSGNIPSNGSFHSSRNQFQSSSTSSQYATSTQYNILNQNSTFAASQQRLGSQTHQNNPSSMNGSMNGSFDNNVSILHK